MLVGCVVVDDGVDFFSRRHVRLDGVEEANELLVPVALHIAADHGAIEDISRNSKSYSSNGLKDFCTSIMERLFHHYRWEILHTHYDSIFLKITRFLVHVKGGV